MTQESPPGARLRLAAANEPPFQIAGAISTCRAITAKREGHRSLCLSRGAAVACHGLPDLGMTTLDDVPKDVPHVPRGTELSLLVDADTGQRVCGPCPDADRLLPVRVNEFLDRFAV